MCDTQAFFFLVLFSDNEKYLENKNPILLAERNLIQSKNYLTFLALFLFLFYFIFFAK